MDSEAGFAGVNGGREKLGESGGEPLSFDEWENRFLELLSLNVNRAGVWVDRLRSALPRLESHERARGRRLIGRYYHTRSNFPEAVEWTTLALNDFRELGDRPGVNRCLRTLLSAHMYCGRYHEARAHAREILEDRSCSRRERLKVYINLGNLEHRLNRFSAALDQFDKASQLLVHDPEMEGIVAYNLANVLVCVNSFSEAESHYRKALAFFEKRGSTLYRAHVLQAQSYLFSILGQYFQAETLLVAAREAYGEGDDLVGSALCNLDLFLLKIRLNQFEAALEEAEALIGQFSKLQMAYETGQVYYHASRAALAGGDEILGEVFLDEAEAIFQRENNRYYLGLCLLLHGNYRRRAGEPERAKELLEAARAIFVEEGLPEPELRCLLNLHRLRRRPPGEAEFQRVRGLLKTPIGFHARVGALLLVSDYWYGRRQLKRAIDNRREAVMILEESRASILSEDQRESFFEDKVRIYETLIEWLFQWKSPRSVAHIFKILELSGSRRFSERLSELERLPPILNRAEPTLLEKQRLESRLLQLERKRHALSKNPEFSAVEMEALLESQREARLAWRGLGRRMRDEERLGLYFPFDLSHREVQKYLPEGHLAVAYFLRDRVLYRLELDRTRLRGVQLELHPRFQAELNELYHILADRLVDRTARMEAILEPIHALLLPRGLSRYSHVIFIPHGALQRFPFALLRWKGRPLLTTHGISMSPNWPALYFSLQKKPARLENPLFFFSEREEDPTAEERRALRQLYPSARVLHSLGPRTLERIAASGFIHFAGHCYFDKRNPRASYLGLAGRRLSLFEIQGMRLNRPFINLAACQSGSISILAGNEPYGFLIDFFAAGAVQVLAGLWDLEDEATGRWMACFYRHLDRGPVEAYRRACLAMMKLLPHPSYWSGFCLFGKP